MLVGSEKKLMYHTSARVQLIILRHVYQLMLGDLRIFKRI